MMDKMDEILAALLRIEKLLENSQKPAVINNTFAGFPANSLQAACEVARTAMRMVGR